MNEENRVKVFWGIILLVGLLLTQALHFWAAPWYANAALWAVLGVAGIVATYQTPYERGALQRFVFFSWIAVAVLGLIITAAVAAAGAIVLTAIAWMTLVGLWILISEILQKNVRNTAPGILALISGFISAHIPALAANIFIVFGIMFAVPLIIIGFLEY